MAAMLPRRPVLGLPAALLASAARAAPRTEAAYVAEVEAWRKRRELRLRSDEGWLTVTGLFWLQNGANPVGSEAKATVRLPAADPPRIGTFLVEGAASGQTEDARRPGASVRFESAPGVLVTLAGAPVAPRPLRTDKAGSPDVLAFGARRFFVIERSGRLAVRLRDLQAPARAAFRGLRWFPVDPAFRVTALFRAHPEPRAVPVPNVLGLRETMTSPGVVEWSWQGQTLRLLALVEEDEPDQLFFIFRDRTNGRDTYGAGRFLYARKPSVANEVILDFNQAYTPPCGFSRFATCPLAPEENRLPVRITAGERAPAEHP